MSFYEQQCFASAQTTLPCLLTQLQEFGKLKTNPARVFYEECFAFARAIPSISRTQLYEFGKLKTNHERVDMCLNDKSVRDFVIYEENQKNDEKAAELRQNGNTSFAKKEYSEAIAFYNASLANAQSNETKALAYANRSAALFKLNFFTECLVDIERAFKHDYPERLQPKLITRREEAQKLMKNQKKQNKAPVISDSHKNQQIQSASDCIKIERNEQYGRHIVATRDIQIGELLIVEKPLVFVVTENYVYCHHCTRFSYSLIPCEKCTEVLYCSEKCKTEALNNYHQYECSILHTLIKLLKPIEKTAIGALKMTFLAMKELDWPDQDDGIYYSDRYKEIGKLLCHADKRILPDLFNYSFTASVVYLLIKNQTKFFEDYKDTNNCENFFKEMLSFHLQILDVNQVILRMKSRKNVNIKSRSLQSLYSLYSLFNHSCLPNSFFYFHGSTIVVRAALTIRKGEQCFVSYGYDYEMPKDKRQWFLERKFFFTCSCIACQKDWSVNTTTMANDINAITITTILLENNRDRANQILKMLIDKLKKIERNIPCTEVVTIQSLIKMYYELYET